MVLFFKIKSEESIKKCGKQKTPYNVKGFIRGEI